MNIPLLDLKRQYREIKGEIEAAVTECLESGIYIQGNQVKSLESELAAYLNVKHAITVANGTDALSITLKAAGVKTGDEVITTPFTFFATSEAIAALGAIPVFADIKGDTYNIDPSCIEDKITSKTKCILPVHIFGQPAEMDEINKIARKHKLIVIEDACQAIGSEYNCRKVGGLGDMACFSFFPTKNLGCFGDGGLITTNDDKLAVICRALREHGGGKNGAVAKNYIDGTEPESNDLQSENPLYNPYKYYNYIIGSNSRLDALQAAILRVKLKYLDQWNDMRSHNAELYHQKLSYFDLALPATISACKPVWHQYAIRHPKKDEFIGFLASKGITAGVFYPVPIHLQKALEYLGYKQGDFPVAEKVTSESVCLPIYPELSEQEINYISKCIKEFV
jgi:dTDP-4-amino-4,6-dideoxygalactose transaminase